MYTHTIKFSRKVKDYGNYKTLFFKGFSSLCKAPSA